MQAAIKLGYLVFEVRKLNRWAQFCEGMLGLPAPLANTDGSLGFQLDEVAQRLVVRPGDADDLAALGLECASDAVLDALLQRLERAGHAVEGDLAALARARRVQRLCRVIDPAGNAVELHTGPQSAARPFGSKLVSGGFCTGELGLGHAVLVSRDPVAMVRFYVDGLGFGVSERLATQIGPITLGGVFLHCNRRHHSVAIFDLPWKKRLHHFMLQTRELADVGAAFERAARLKVPLSLGLGQHPDPDGTFSFYGRTPSGFDFEIGAGSKEIEPRGWRPVSATMTSSWGHKPRLQLRLRMAAAMIRRSRPAA